MLIRRVQFEKKYLAIHELQVPNMFLSSLGTDRFMQCYGSNQSLFCMVSYLSLAWPDHYCFKGRFTSNKRPLAVWPHKSNNYYYLCLTCD